MATVAPEGAFGRARHSRSAGRQVPFETFLGKDGGMAEPPRRKPKAPLPAPARDLHFSQRQFLDTMQRPPAGPEPAARQIARPAIAEAARDVRALAPPGGPTLTRRHFEAEYRRLLRQFGEARENPGSVACRGCQSCASCMFCVDCERCYRCTHSTRCQDGSHLTHCQDCRNCHACAYCLRSESCSGSSYLVLCRSCSDSTYCFGCVGLSKKDFHVLNVKYTRDEYFRIVKALRAEMGI
jgi:hypothetical protein